MLDAVQLAVFSGHLSSVCEEMGVVLQRSAFSPNIKDRLDYSCAFFDKAGRIIAQAAHIPVHLGSMAFAMQDIIAEVVWFEGDVLVLNDPFKGGTHLPDVTLVSPVYENNHLIGFIANRAHHANIGCDSPGSMPLSTTLSQEGVLISPQKLYVKGVLQPETVALLTEIEGSLTTAGLSGDFAAQLSANAVGVQRLKQWLSESDMDSVAFAAGLEQINQYGRSLAIKSFAGLPKGESFFSDYLDGDGISPETIKISARLVVGEDSILVDFSGTSSQVAGNLNCPQSVCAAAVYYVFAGLLPEYVPHCDGVFRLIKMIAPEGSLLNASPGAAVAAGNVETSMRIVDVVLGALNKLGVDAPAASQGTMNNVAMGGRVDAWDYYETIGGGAGAGSQFAGLSATQCHMTNTLNTPVESLELHYPLMITEYSIRQGSGGAGIRKGGDGVTRSYQFRSPTSITLLTDRRLFSPWGAAGGSDGAVGSNYFNGQRVASKVVLLADEGDCLQVNTPGGGGWGILNEKNT